MSTNATAQNTTPQSNSGFPYNGGDRTKNLLPYKHLDVDQPNESNPLLHIPYEMMELYTLKPRTPLYSDKHIWC